MVGMQRVWSAQSDAVGCSQTQLMRSDRKLTRSDAVGTRSDVVGRGRTQLSCDFGKADATMTSQTSIVS